MSLLAHKSLKDLVHEVVDVTASPDLADCPDSDRHAFQVGAALSRFRKDALQEPASDMDGYVPAG